MVLPFGRPSIVFEYLNTVRSLSRHHLVRVLTDIGQIPGSQYRHDWSHRLPHHLTTDIISKAYAFIPSDAEPDGLPFLPPVHKAGTIQLLLSLCFPLGCSNAVQQSHYRAPGSSYPEPHRIRMAAFY